MSSSPVHKKPCEPKTIGTHNGKFHCDEALACYMLRLLPEYTDAKVVRSRKPEVLKLCDVVVDVGGVYDPSIHRYDHHQRSFTDTMHSLTGSKKRWETKLSSAGLVYLHFGQRVLNAIAGIDVDSTTAEDRYDYVYSNLVEEIDGVDNGISDKPGDPRYKVTTSISHRVGELNPTWNEDQSDTIADMRFQQAMQLVGGELRERVSYFHKSWLPARQIVVEAVNSRHEVHSGGEVIKLSRYCPWKEHLFSLEETLAISPNIKYVLYAEKEEVGSKWRIQAVPKHPASFENRLSLPALWCGLREEQLSSMAGVSGCIFVHSNGFIGGNVTFEGALKMATLSLQQLSESLGTENET